MGHDLPGEPLTRDELRRQLWGDDAFVDFDAGLNFCVRQLRLALGDSAGDARFIQTVPRRGYRFVATTVESPVAVAGEARALPQWRAARLVAGVALAIVTVSAAAGSYFAVSAAAPRLTPEARIADAHAARGFVALNDEWSWAAAGRAFERALQLDPQHEVALISMSRLHASQGRFAASVDFARRAVNAHPGSPRAQAMLGWALLFAGDAVAARDTCAKLLVLTPKSTVARLCRLNADAELGVHHDEIWTRVLGRLQSSDEPGSSFLRATVAARAGRTELALDELVRALDAREPEASFALVHPALAPLRQDPVFARATVSAGLVLAP